MSGTSGLTGTRFLLQHRQFRQKSAVICGPSGPRCHWWIHLGRPNHGVRPKTGGGPNRFLSTTWRWQSVDSINRGGPAASGVVASSSAAAAATASATPYSGCSNGRISSGCISRSCCCSNSRDRCSRNCYSSSFRHSHYCRVSKICCSNPPTSVA